MLHWWYRKRRLNMIHVSRNFIYIFYAMTINSPSNVASQIMSSLQFSFFHFLLLCWILDFPCKLHVFCLPRFIWFSVCCLLSVFVIFERDIILVTISVYSVCVMIFVLIEKRNENQLIVNSFCYFFLFILTRTTQWIN